MFKQFRPLEIGEFIIAGGDCSQGGDDFNVTQFFSKDKLDVPLIYRAKSVANSMTTAIQPVLENIATFTGIKPMVALERNMGGASEMERLSILNRDNYYELFLMPQLGTEDKINVETKKLGFNTNTLSRPILVGSLKEIIDIHGIGIYDEDTINELATFINNNQGKPEASKGAHDDCVIALAISWFVSNRSVKRSLSQPITNYNNKKWRLQSALSVAGSLIIMVHVDQSLLFVLIVDLVIYQY